MRNPNCYESFNEGRAARARYPLPHGRYKLVECVNRLEDCGAEIAKIRRVVTGKANHWILTHCTPEDKDIWLRDLPVNIAYRLGYEVLPGLLALEENGADPDDIATVYPLAQKACFQLLDRLESARITIKGCIKVEYSLMRHDGSLLEPLVLEAIDIASLALDVLETPG